MEDKSKAYSEVVEILKLIDDEKRLEKIPFEVIELIKGNSDPAYKPQISREIPLEEQNLQKDTYSIMAWIASKYWDEDIEEIEPNLNADTNIIENKETEKTEVKTNCAVYNDMEKEALEGRNLPVLVSELSLYQRIKAKIISILRHIFKRKEIKEGVN